MQASFLPDEARQNRDDVLECIFLIWMSRLSQATNINTAKAGTALTQANKSGPWASDQCKQLAAGVMAGN